MWGTTRRRNIKITSASSQFAITLSSRVRSKAMPRNMSFSITTAQVQTRTKTVTRRLGSRTLEMGVPINAVKKAMGLKKGEKVQKLAVILPIHKRRERLNRMLKDKAYGAREVVLEGFPEMSPTEFVEMFCR